MNDYITKRTFKGPFFEDRSVYLVMLVIYIGSVCSCREKRSLEIDHERIDELFGKNVSEVLFDHLYVVVDSITYTQLLQNTEWQGTYAAMDKGLPDFATLDKTTTSCYLRGYEHFIELLGPDNEYNEPVGKSGIGFLLSNHGEHFHLGVMPKLKQSETPYLSKSETVNMPIGKEETTWFKAFYSPSMNTALHTWYAFYNPAFLNRLHQTEHYEYSRAAFLRKSYREGQLFKGIESIDIICTFADYERIAQEMRQLGCRLMSKKENTLTISSGDISLSITPSRTINFSRITQIKCGLNASDNRQIALGNLTITNSGTQSVWNLENLYQEDP